MKLYKRLKGMSRRTKFGLVGTALYTAMLTSPLYAKETKPEQVKSIKPDLEQLMNMEQADVLLKQKMEEYASDKLLIYDEIFNLDQIFEKKKTFILAEERDFTEKTNKVFDAVNSLKNEIKDYDSDLENLKWEKNYTHPRVEKIKEDLDDKVIIHYPSLFKKEANITYSAETKLKPKLVKTLKEMIVEIHGINVEFYEDNDLEILAGQDDYNIGDLISFSEILNRDRIRICFNEKEINAKKAEILDKKILVHLKLAEILNSDGYKSVSEQKANLSSKELKLDFARSNFKDYIALKNHIDSFKEDYGDFSKYVGVSYRLMSKLKKDNYEINSPASVFGDGQIVFGLQTYFKLNNLEIDVERMGDPTKTKIPTSWMMWLAGLTFPIIRNVFVRTYVGRIEGLEDENIDYWLGVFSGGFNGILGTYWLDGLHHLVWYGRMFGTPLIVQPLFKFLEGKDKKR